MRFVALLVLALVSCSELKKQARLGLGGSGSSQSARPPGDLRQGPDGALVNGGAAIGSAIGASVASRALGGCVAACPPGTSCNEKTGLCDTLPCRGMCQHDEVCQNERCIPVLLPGLNIKQQPAR